MIDQVTHEALTRILGTPVDDRSWHQAKPVSMGGLGLRGVENHGSATYAASLLSSQLLTQSLMKLSWALCLVGLTQKQMSLKVDLKLQRQLLQGVGEEENRERARLSSLGLPHAGDWLNTAPLKALGLHLRATEFILVVKYRLGLFLFDTAGPCPACLRHSGVWRSCTMLRVRG